MRQFVHFNPTLRKPLSKIMFKICTGYLTHYRGHKQLFTGSTHACATSPVKSHTETRELDETLLHLDK